MVSFAKCFVGGLIGGAASTLAIALACRMRDDRLNFSSDDYSAFFSAGSDKDNAENSSQDDKADSNNIENDEAEGDKSEKN